MAKIRILILAITKKIRVLMYKFMSERQYEFIANQPVLIKGKGNFCFSNNIQFGVESSPFFFSGYGYIESRNANSLIRIGDSTFINNNCSIVAEGGSISIGSNCLIGLNFQVSNSDFHDISPSGRLTGGNTKRADVHIEDNVFIGNNVTVLKGVRIGKNTSIGSGSIVVKSIPSNVVAAGVPATVIRTL
ncbi:hypothetical protein BIY21_14060 [Vibrio ponticus]|uniref:Acyltransferase n=1 Tax=Vibrio ponticus TaxID=265668 RepID=A0ABX3FDM1_9VIBR|nr:DapH/DapD/GlmU-related protein [Vibrio ponticus]OLQ89951.1 hypothetical protein BIY21_14060 [Vibrio ponticus]